MRRGKILAVVLSATSSLPSFAQTFGEISGLVTDSSGAVVLGATITVTNQQTNFTRGTTSNSTGNYNFPSLPPGLYDVRAEMQGFQTEVRSAVELQVQQSARIDFRLNIGSLTETVQVTGGAPLLNTENASVGTVIEQKRIEDLPLNGRSFISLISLSTNVISGQTSSGGFADIRGGTDRGAVSISIAGNRREYNYYTLDGVSNTDIDFNTYAFLPSIDALQEFKVQTGVYSAEFGREAAQVNVSTRSGSNSYHGTLFEFLRNNVLDARPYAFTSRVPASAPFKWNQYGFTLGGPVQIPKLFNGRDRLFFMSNYEGFKLRNQAQAVFSVPSAAMRTGNFSAILPGTVIKDPLNNNLPFTDNIIPTKRLDPIALGLLEFYPLPNIPGAGLSNNLLVQQDKSVNKDQFSQRIDFMESAKSNWFGRYSWQDEFKISPYIYLNGVTVSNQVKQAMVSNTRILSPALVNEFRFGWLGYHNMALNELAFKRDVIKELNIPILDPPPAAWGVPEVPIQGFSTSTVGYLGDGLQGPFLTNDHTFQWVDNISWTRGSHSIKFGGDIRRDRYNVDGNQIMRGQFNVQNQATGYGFSDFMLGYIAASSQSPVLASVQLRGTSQAYYITDNWKVRKNLTVEVGVRYEYTQPWNSRGDSMTNTIIPDNVIFQANVPESQHPHPYLARDCSAYGQNSFYPPESIVRFDLSVKTVCDSSYGFSSLVHSDFTNWAPRLGIAWSPTSKWTLRLGGGIFYAQDQGNSYLDAARNLSGKIQINANFTTHDLTFQRPFGNASTTACGVPSPPFVCVTSPGVTATDPNIRTAYVEQYTMNIQRQITDSTVLELGYLGSQGHRLLTRVGYNTAIPGTTGSVLSRQPFPEFSNIQDTIGIASSNYHSATIKLTRRLSKGLSYLASYTFSKSLDNSAGIFPANGTASRQPANGWCVSCEYARSDGDTPHRFVASILYELPFGRGKTFLNQGVTSALLGGWQLNSIITKSTGFPITVFSGTNRANSNTNAANQRPDSVPGASYKLDHQSTGEWFNIRAFSLPALGTNGNVGRNTVVGPGIFSWDFSTLKNFNFTERSYLQFRFECFNCANHPNFADPATSLSADRLDASGIPILGSGAFGTITSTRGGIDMRQLQFSLKLIF